MEQMESFLGCLFLKQMAKVQLQELGNIRNLSVGLWNHAGILIRPHTRPDYCSATSTNYTPRLRVWVDCAHKLCKFEVFV
jgi:hypothetical protein